MATNIQSGDGKSRKAARKSALHPPRGNKGETTPPVAVRQLIAEVGRTPAARLLGITVAPIRKPKMDAPDARISKAYELLAEHILRERRASRNGAGAVTPKDTTVRPVAPGGKRLAILNLEHCTEDHADQLEQIARAWGAEFTKA